MKKLFGKLILVVAISVGLSWGSVAFAAKKILLKTPIAFSTNLPTLGSTIKYLSDRIKIATDGNINVKIYEPGKLVAAFEILDAVSTGKVNAGFSTAGYWAGKLPASPIFSAVPFGPEPGEFMAWFFYGNGMKLYQEMYDRGGYNVKVLLCGMIPPETSGWFAKPINSVADLQGLKMRFFGLGGQVMQKLGVSTTLLPGGEIFSALEKGAIEATEFSMPAIDQRLGFHKLVKYNYFPGWHQQATSQELLINKKTWNSMTKTQKMQLEMACSDTLVNTLAYGEFLQFGVMQENVKKLGVKNMRWSEAMLATFKKTWDEVAAEQSAKDPFFKKVYEDLSAFRDQYDIWESHAFLPRAKP